MTTVRTLRDLGAAVREARVTAGLTQQELATRVGLARQWVIQLEAGRTNPTWENVRAVCDALGLALDLSQPTAHDAAESLTEHMASPRTPAPRTSEVDLDDVIDLHTHGGRGRP